MNGLLVTVLTGRRPRLLSRTLRTIERHARDLLERARVVAFINGGDQPSVDVVQRYSWVTKCIVGDEPLLGIGAAVTYLWQQAKVGDAEYLLHLEDDWECHRGGWFGPAQKILDRDPKIGQVRLRRDVPTSAVGHAVMRYHMVTGKPLRWETKRLGDVRYLRARAHLTFNPALVHGRIAEQLIPCSSEKDAAARFHQLGLLAAQWLPGAFGHMGNEQSLREREGKP